MSFTEWSYLQCLKSWESAIRNIQGKDTSPESQNNQTPETDMDMKDSRESTQDSSENDPLSSS